MKRLRLLAGIGLLLIAGPAAAQYGGNGGLGGFQTGDVQRPSDDEDNVGVDDGSGIIQGSTDLHKNKPKKKKQKDPNCREEHKNGYRVSNCW